MKIHAALLRIFLTLCPVLMTIVPGGAGAASASSLSLAGSWRFELDPEDTGVSDRWFTRALPRLIRLPGALQNQGYGNEIRIDTPWTGDVKKDVWLNDSRYEPYRQPGRIKIPWALQPRKHYVGVAWYQRDFSLSEEWLGKRLVLHLERPHWETMVWVDDRAMGSNNSLSTPHRYDLGHDLAGGRHTLTIRVDNRVKVRVGDWAHSVTDHTQGNWNGLVGRIELRSGPLVWLDELSVHPDAAEKSILVRGRLGNQTGLAGTSPLEITVSPVRTDETPAPAPFDTRHSPAVAWTAAGGEFEFRLPLDDAAGLWDEFHPALHELRIVLKATRDQRVVRFGLREVAVRDRQFLINERPTFLRGTLECSIFPRTGYPPTHVEAWKRIIRVCQAHGLNHIRFHSWCPPEAAFIAADELGFYYQVECAAWTAVGDGGPIDAWLHEETERIVQEYGNHPSMILLAYGNEPGGKNRDAWLTDWVESWRARDPRRLYTTAAGWPALPVNQFHVIPAPRGPKGWGGNDYAREVASFEVPVVVHEMGQWCVFPNLDEIPKYTGPLQPFNFEIARDFLRNNGMLDQWRDFLRASGRLQALCYKEEIEAALRTPGIGGVQLLDLHDFPGQGTALVGVLDAFWEEKGYISPAEFRRFYNVTVPLARMEKRVWTREETFAARLELAHYGPAPLARAHLWWRVTDARGMVLRQGRTAPRTVSQGRSDDWGEIRLPLQDWAAPGVYRLIVGVDGTSYENDWTWWVYPPPRDAAVSPEILVTSQLNETALTRLREGGRVLLAGPRLGPRHPRNSFAPIFWNRFMFANQRTQTLGLWCDPQHPALRGFPTSFHSDWQWEPLLAGSRAIVMDDLPVALRPIVQVIDDWNRSRKLGLVFEARVGSGRLLVCAADLTGDPGKRPVQSQLRRSLLEYMDTPAFAPGITAEQSTLVELLQFMPASKLARMGARLLSVSSEDTEHEHLGRQIMDGDPETFWHTRWGPDADPMPHELVIDLGENRGLAGLVFLQRQDMGNGWIQTFDVLTCQTAEPGKWNMVLDGAQLPPSGEMQKVLFAQPANTRLLKLRVRSEVNGNPFAALAEMDVILKE